MDTSHETSPDFTMSLTEVFARHSGTALHETCSDVCHAFEMYDVRNELVREAAYLRAKTRGLVPGHELEDWLAAEHDVDARLFAEIAPVGFVG